MYGRRNTRFGRGLSSFFCLSLPAFPVAIYGRTGYMSPSLVYKKVIFWGDLDLDLDLSFLSDLDHLSDLDL